MCALRLKPGIGDISPYVGGESDIAGVDRIIKLSSNESALGPSPKAAAAMEAARQTLGDPLGVARVLAFLASDEGSYVRGTVFTR